MSISRRFFGRLRAPSSGFLLLPSALVVLVVLGGSVSVAQPVFEDVTSEAGLAGFAFLTQHDHGLGVAWIDFDGDDLPDIFAVNGMGQAEHLFRNSGDGTFETVDHLLPALPDVEMMGAVFADYDNDGDSDLYVFTDNEVMETLDGPPNLLLRNLWVESGGTAVPLFEEVAAAAGVDDGVPIPFGSYPCYRSATGSWLDYDRDGLVDLYVGHWTFGAPGHEANGNRLYHNLGDGTFEDVTGQAGLPLAADVNELRPTLAMAGAHLDDDLWPDLYVANVRDPAPFFEDQVYRNQGDGTFADVTALSPGVGNDAEAAMGSPSATRTGTVSGTSTFPTCSTPAWTIRPPATSSIGGWEAPPSPTTPSWRRGSRARPRGASPSSTPTRMAGSTCSSGRSAPTSRTICTGTRGTAPSWTWPTPQACR